MDISEADGALVSLRNLVSSRGALEFVESEEVPPLNLGARHRREARSQNALLSWQKVDFSSLKMNFHVTFPGLTRLYTCIWLHPQNILQAETPWLAFGTTARMLEMSS